MNLNIRETIEEGLNNGNTFTKISKDIGYHRTTIANEIIKRRLPAKERTYGRTFTYCAFEGECDKIDGDYCTHKCSMFQLKQCSITSNPPYVCNGCSKKNTCKKQRFFYRAKDAQEDYDFTLKDSRTGLNISPETINKINSVIAPLIKEKHQTVNQVFLNHPDILCFSKSEFYRLVKEGYLDIKCIDLPRANKPVAKIEVDKTYKRDIEGHTYEDYLKKKEENPNIIEWQMDCVQGIQGKKEQVFLTLQIVKIKFLFIFILNAHTNEEVIKKLKLFNEVLKSDELNKLIELLLTDNGHEFINLDKLIEAIGHEYIYYCHPYSSYEKGSIENNHELLRRIIPQGVSLNIYNEEDIRLVCSHINSLYRKELNGKCPFDLINDYLTDDTLKKLGYSKIDPKDVMLIPELLGGKNILNIKKYLTPNDIKKENIKFNEEMEDKLVNNSR